MLLGSLFVSSWFLSPQTSILESHGELRYDGFES